MSRPDFTNHTDTIAEIIRVDHAGEYGAKRIYEGQLKFTKLPHEHHTIREMLEQEVKHLDYFSKELVKRDIKPTSLMFFWHTAGYMLGALSALIGPRTAMLVTQSVEEVIEKHYQKQIEYLMTYDDAELLNNIKQFRLDEIAHKDTAIEHNSNDAMFASLTTKIVKLICQTAISLSKKI